MFEELFTPNTDSENNASANKYIFRQIKLDKHLDLIKKKIHNTMGKEELKKIMPPEELLRNALIDESIPEEDE